MRYARSRVAGVGLIAAGLVVLYGCATVINHTTQSVFLQTDPPGATATIDGAKQVATPVSIKLKRGKDHMITFDKPGYKTTTITIDREMSGWVWGNIVLGGLIGLAIDFTSGGAYKLNPNTVTVTLQSAS